MSAEVGVRIPVCWNRDTAVATISTDAVSPAPEVFFATHVPLRIRRRHPDVTNAGDAERIDEEEVRRDFLTRKPVNGVLLMPVIGESGTGKSHLVRWVHERTESNDRRAVVYVPKAKTSLRALIHILLERDDVDTPELRKLREKVDDYTADYDVETLQLQLILKMADVVASADDGGNKYRRVLVGTRGLANVLRDVHVQKYLTAPGALIPRLASSLLADRSDGEPDRPTEFGVGDLPEIVNVNDAAVEVRKLLQQLMGNAELQAAAAELLTEALSPAVQAVFGMGSGQLHEAMLTIRREYLKQGKEIVLLIEDFAVIQGVQRDLLDALIEPGIRQGEKVLAPVRTLMAVTSGYYARLADTVITRAQSATPYVYDLDIDFDASQQMQSDAMEFVGRYFNAARLGGDVLREAGVASGTPAPNKCDSCEFRVPCHNTFGASPGGYGIFPLNWPALRRAIKSRPVPGDRQGAFNPRTVIGQVISPILEEADSISTGTFPTEKFRSLFPTPQDERALSSEVQVAIAELDSKHASRRAILLEYWGDAPPELVNLDPTIHATFQLPPLSNVSASGGARGGTSEGRTVGGQGGDSSSPPPPERSTGEVPPSVRAHLDAIDAWVTGRANLAQDTARKIRVIVRQAVVNRCQWNRPLTAEPDSNTVKKAWPQNSTVVSIEAADAENLPGTKDAPIRFTRSAENAVFFKGLVRLEAGIPDPRDGRALRRLARIAETHSSALERAVMRVRNADDEWLTTWFSASLLGASLCGHAWPGMSDEELIDVVFDPGTGWTLEDVAIRSEPWLKLYEAHRAGRENMVLRLQRLVGITRGKTGAPRIIDAARVLPLLRKATQAWEWRPDGPLPSPLKEATAGLAQLDRLAEEQVGRLRELNGELSRLLPEGISGAQTLDAVAEAFEQALGVGLGPLSEPDPTRFRDRLKALRAADWKSVSRLRSDLAAIEKAEDDRARRLAVLKAVAVDRGRDVAAIVEFLRMCDEWFDARLNEGYGGAHPGDQTASKVAEFVARWRKVVRAE